MTSLREKDCTQSRRRRHACLLIISALKLALARERFAQKRLRVSAISSVITSALRGDSMGKEARVGLLLAGACCLLACMVDWIIVEL
jgi:hypothetical protein